jgi:hypothetical protein
MAEDRVARVVADAAIAVELDADVMKVERKVVGHAGVARS